MAATPTLPQPEPTAQLQCRASHLSDDHQEPEGGFETSLRWATQGWQRLFFSREWCVAVSSFPGLHSLRYEHAGHKYLASSCSTVTYTNPYSGQYNVSRGCTGSSPVSAQLQSGYTEQGRGLYALTVTDLVRYAFRYGGQCSASEV